LMMMLTHAWCLLRPPRDSANPESPTENHQDHDLQPEY
jgi:hypothetical protein